MHFADVYDKILFLTVICSSFFNALYTISMNKKASQFKLLGMSFIVPLSLCFFTFIFSSNIPAALILSYSEFYLSLLLFLLIFHPYNVESHKIKSDIIIIGTIVISLCSVLFQQVMYSLLPASVIKVMIVICICMSLVFLKKKSIEQKLITPLALWFIGATLAIFGNQLFIKQIILFIKISAYIAFYLYFYKTTYNTYIKKIKESEKLKDTLEKSLNKEVRKRVFEIERSNERLLEISKTDLLTKSFNKITILNLIDKLINNKREEIFSILMFDIDNFKTINDTLGHVTGDLCLKTLSNIASSNIREIDYIGRYGGDEFIIVLPSLGDSEAKYVAERFKKKVNEISNPKFTVSIGIATYPYDGQTVNELISAADKGLYKSKSMGKNAISHATHY